MKANLRAAGEGKRSLPEKYQLFLMLLPFLALVFVFSYLPLAGWRYAFYLYRPGFDLKDCQYVGLYWFESIFSNSFQIEEITRVMINTLGISGLGLLLNCMAPLFAVLLNEIHHKPYRKVVQVLTTLPNFISWVLVYAVAFALFNVDAGLINRILLGLGWIDKPINFLASNKHVWLSMTLWTAWKTLGWSGILYLAAIAGIDQEQYEAARVDGANWSHIFFRIVIPLSIPVFITAGLMIFVSEWNNYLWPLLVTRSEEVRTIQVSLAYFKDENETFWSYIYAASSISAIVPVLVYLPLQKYFVQGIACSGIKG